MMKARVAVWAMLSAAALAVTGCGSSGTKLATGSAAAKSPPGTAPAYCQHAYYVTDLGADLNTVGNSGDPNVVKAVVARDLQQLRSFVSAVPAANTADATTVVNSFQVTANAVGTVDSAAPDAKTKLQTLLAGTRQLLASPEMNRLSGYLADHC